MPMLSIVLLLLTVGFDNVSQQTQRAVIVAPSLEVIVPPHSTVVNAILFTLAVVSTGTLCGSIFLQPPTLILFP